MDQTLEMSLSDTPPVRNQPLPTARSSSLRCVSAAYYQTAEQYSKTGRTKPRKHLLRCDLSWNTLQDFLKIPSLCKAALETEWRCFSKVIFKSNVTPKITRSSDSFSTVPPIVNWGDWGCIVRDLKTIVVLVLLAFNFIPQRSRHSLALPRSRIRDFATATHLGMAQQLAQWSHQHNRSAYFPSIPWLSPYTKEGQSCQVR